MHQDGWLRPRLVPAVLAAALMGILALGGWTAALGAHPMWTDTTVMFGAAAGFAVWLVLSALRVPGWAVLVMGLLAGLAALWVARHGGETFAASYAEDRMAGRLWYFGWIATSAMLYVVLAETLTRLGRSRG